MLKVLKLGDPKLRLNSSPISEIDADHRKLAKEMISTMKIKDGVGLAAPQVGRNVRLIVLRFNTEKAEGEEIICAINPLVTPLSNSLEEGEEGCLSIPGIYGPVTRQRDIRFDYLDLDGKDMSRDLSGFDARIVQHEIDHLEGVLFIDLVKDKNRLLKVSPGEEPKGAI